MTLYGREHKYGQPCPACEENMGITWLEHMMMSGEEVFCFSCLNCGYEYHQHYPQIDKKDENEK